MDGGGLSSTYGREGKDRKRRLDFPFHEETGRSMALAKNPPGNSPRDVCLDVAATIEDEECGLAPLFVLAALAWRRAPKERFKLAFKRLAPLVVHFIFHSEVKRARRLLSFRPRPPCC